MDETEKAAESEENLVILGFKVTRPFKERVAIAASLERRTLSSWCRVALEDAANAVIEKHSSKRLELLEPTDNLKEKKSAG